MTTLLYNTRLQFVGPGHWDWNSHWDIDLCQTYIHVSSLPVLISLIFLDHGNSYDNKWALKIKFPHLGFLAVAKSKFFTGENFRDKMKVGICSEWPNMDFSQ